MEVSITFPARADQSLEKDIHHIHPFSTYNSSTSRQRDVAAIVAFGNDMSIGRQGEIPWRLHEDMLHFKELTMGHPVIMGRHTWESLPKRPLPGRRNIVISRNPDFSAPGAETFTSLEEAVAACEPHDIPFIIGGAEVYRKGLPYCTRLYVTEVNTEISDADTFFPEIDSREWEKIEECDSRLSAEGLRYRYVTYARKS